MLLAVIAIMATAATPSLSTALTECRNARAWAPSRLLLQGLLDAEEEVGVPEHLQGMTLAAACHESGYRPWVTGDDGRAVGVLQMWPGWRRRGVDRLDPFMSARAWLERIAVLVPKARRLGCRRPWIAAWAWVGSGPKGYTCRAPRHLDVLRRFQRDGGH